MDSTERPVVQNGWAQSSLLMTNATHHSSLVRRADLRSLAHALVHHCDLPNPDQCRSLARWLAPSPTTHSSAYLGLRPQVSVANFSYRGDRFITASNDNTAAVWASTAPYQVLFELKGHENSVKGCCFSPDDRHCATASFDRSVRLWDATDGRHIQTLGDLGDWVLPPIHPCRLLSRALTHTHTHMTTGIGLHLLADRSEPRVRQWSSDRGRGVGHTIIRARAPDLYRPHRHGACERAIESIARSLDPDPMPRCSQLWDCKVSPSGTDVVVASFDTKLSLWDMRVLSERKATLARHTGQVRASRLSCVLVALIRECASLSLCVSLGVEVPIHG